MEDYKSKYDDIQIERMLRENAERRRENSIGSSKVTSHRNKKKNGLKKKIVIAAIILSVLTAAGVKIVPEIVDTVSFANDLEMASEVVTNEAMTNLAKAGLVTVDENGIVTINKNNTSEDYSKLGLVDASLGEFYAYREAIDKASANTEGFSEIIKADEFDKLVKGSSYEDGRYNYTDTSQFYRVNGLTAPDGDASSLEFDKYAKQELVKAYRNGNIEGVLEKTTDEVKGK